MNTRFVKIYLGVALAFSALVPLAGPANAGLFEIDYTVDGAFSGTPPGSPASGVVFATAIFDDGGGTGTVTLTMTVDNNLSAGAYINDWYFNVNPAPLSNVVFSSGQAASTVAFDTADAYKADGTGGGFDFVFHFPTSNPGQLGQGLSSVYTLTGTGITADSFDSVSVSAPPNANNGGATSAIHVQGYGNSVWIAGTGGAIPPEETVPEPSVLALLSIALLGLGLTTVRRRS